MNKQQLILPLLFLMLLLGASAQVAVISSYSTTPLAIATNSNIQITGVIYDTQGSQVRGTVTLKNTGTGSQTFLTEMQVVKSGSSFLSFLLSPDQKTCDPAHPENVHISLTLAPGESKTIQLVSPQSGALADGDYKMGLFLATVCYADAPGTDRSLPGYSGNYGAFNTGTISISGGSVTVTTQPTTTTTSTTTTPTTGQLEIYRADVPDQIPLDSNVPILFYIVNPKDTQVITKFEVAWVDPTTDYGKSIPSQKLGTLSLFGRANINEITGCPGLAEKQSVELILAPHSDNAFEVRPLTPKTAKDYYLVLGSYNNCGEAYTAGVVKTIKSASFVEKGSIPPPVTPGKCPAPDGNSCIPVGCNYKDTTGLFTSNTAQCCETGLKVSQSTSRLLTGTTTIGYCKATTGSERLFNTLWGWFGSLLARFGKVITYILIIAGVITALYLIAKTGVFKIL